MNAIELVGVSKTYRIPHERHTTLAERMLALFRPVPVEVLSALQDVTFAVPAGSFTGVIGLNGSGKSTLLKIIASVLVPDSGTVRVHGTVAPLLELGVGFQPDLTVRENVALYATVLGYPRADLGRRIDEVIAFAEIEQFRDAKLKTLSSGMRARLAFGTALRAESDILLLDEVLAVGDAHFQRKCFAVFEDLRRAGRTIVLVSHDLLAIQRFCDRVFWLNRGRVIREGPAEDVVQTYLGLAPAGEDAFVRELTPEEERQYRWGDARVRYLEGRLESEDGAPVTCVRAGSRVVLRLVAEAREDTAAPVFAIVLHVGGETLYSTNSTLVGDATGALVAGERVEVRVPFTAALANGVYTLNVAIADRATGTIHDWINHFVTFVVEGSACNRGPADLHAGFAMRSSGPDAALDAARSG